MKAKILAVVLLGLMQSTLAAGAQQPTPLQLGDPYHCSGGVNVTVTRCYRQAEKEYCEFKLEQNGKIALEDANLRDKIADAVKSCAGLAADSSARSTAAVPRTMA